MRGIQKPRSPMVRHYRGVVGALSRSRPTDDPDLIEARRRLAVASANERIDRALTGAPPEALARLRELLAVPA